MNLDQESERATEMLAGKIVTNILRHRRNEVLMEFADGSRLFIDSAADVEMSITGENESFNPQNP